MAEVRADHIVMPGDGQKYISNDGHTTSSRQTPRSPWTYVLLALLVVLLIFPVITIPILFWQYSKINSNYLTVKHFSLIPHILK